VTMLRFLLILLLFRGVPAWATSDLLPALHNFDRLAFATLRSDHQLAVVFAPDCLPCRAMVRDLSCLEPKTKIVLLGVGEVEATLRKAYSSYNTSLPAYMVSERQFRAIGGKVGATPQLWFLKSGAVRVGKMSCTNLRALLDQETPARN